MASRVMTRPQAQRIDQDRATLQAIRGLPSYRSISDECSLEMLNQAEAALSVAEERLNSLTSALAHARAEFDVASLTFHERILHAKNQVLAQYGNDAPEVQAIGLKRRSMRRRPSRRANAA